MTSAIIYPAIYRESSSGPAVLFTQPNPTENDTMYFSLNGTDFEPLNMISGGWHGESYDERHITFVVVPVDGYHADEYLRGATRHELKRKLQATVLTVDDETYVYDPDADLDKVTIRKHPTVDYDMDTYRRFYNEVRLSGKLLLSGLMGTQSTDCWPSFNVDRGDRVRGTYRLVTADPARLDGVLKTLSDEIGQRVVFATTYELMDYGLRHWDQQTKVVCAGTRIGLMDSGCWNHNPAYFALTPQDGGRVVPEWIRDFGESQILCVITE